MTRFLRTIFLLTALLNCGSALGNEYKVDLITCDPGKQLYASFGHSSFMVTNTETDARTIYNFGCFDFNTPNFYLKFLRGDLNYFLGVSEGKQVNAFFESYLKDGRDIYIQSLDLTAAEAEEIVRLLNWLALPENKYYNYKFVEKNCTTELRDLLFAVVSADEELLNSPDSGTYRYYLDQYFVEKPWIRFGINLILGSKIDRPITFYESLCLPEQLYNGLSVVGADNDRSLVINEKKYTSYNKVEQHNDWGRYLPLMLSVLLLIITLFSRSKYVDFSIFFILGILGLVILFLMAYGQHMEFKANYNILWCNPLFILMPFLIGAKNEKAARVVSIIILLCIAATWVVWIFNVQAFLCSYIVLSGAGAWLVVKYSILPSIINKRKLPK